MPVQTRHKLPFVTASLFTLRSFAPHFHINASEQIHGVTGQMTVVWLVDNTMVRVTAWQSRRVISASHRVAARV